MLNLTKKELSWALYDVGNSAFFTTIMAGFFPVFFKEYWHAGSDPTLSSYHLGLTNSLSALAVAFLAPFVGAIADIKGRKKPFLVIFSAIGILSALILPFIGKGQYEIAMWVFGLGMLGVSTSVSINDSQLSDVTEESRYHKVSSCGYALGYLGGGILFLVNVLMTLMPEKFGLANASQAVKISFFSVGIWWIIFIIPILRNVHDHPKNETISTVNAIKLSFKQLIGTIKKIMSQRNLAIFLLAYWLYIDGVGTVMKMAVDYGLSIGFEAKDLISALLIVQFVGFPASLLFGRIGNKWGAKTGIFIGIAIYGVITLLGLFMTTPIHFYGLAVLIALVQGGVQALSRSLFAELTPKENSSEYFGFYNMLGKFAAVMGPFLMGYVAVVTGDTKISMLSVIVLFALGGFFLSFVKTQPEKA